LSDGVKLGLETAASSFCFEGVAMHHELRALVVLSGLIASSSAIAQESTTEKPAQAPAAEAPAPATDQAALEKAFAEMLSGATLEGSFTSTGRERDPTKLSREKYTIGQVRKIAGNIWLIPARIQYGERDLTVPVPAPVRWAGDTPVIVVDNVPGLENMSARVLFFADHYAGYWRHGDQGGHLFGTITRGDKPAESQVDESEDAPTSVSNPAGSEQRN
jgi:hypothetical protein